MTICLTFDTDHMSEKRMASWFQKTPIEGVATFYCQEAYGCLAGTQHLQAPHPDFAGSTNFFDVIERYQSMFSQSRTWRSHSLMFSQSICVELFRRGYSSVSVTERFGDMDIRPNRLPWGPIDFSIYYMDNSDFCNFNGMRGPDHVPFSKTIISNAITESLSGSDKVFVFDFHPIHLALNTLSYETYAAERDLYKNEGKTSLESKERFGVWDFYLALIEEMKIKGVKSQSLEVVSERYTKNC